MIDIKIKILRDGVNLPEYKTEGAAALDLASAADSAITIPAGGRALIPTGIAISIGSPYYVALVCARSGLSTKFGVSLANGIGVIDSDYRGEIFVSLINHGDADYTVEIGERVAQLMFMPIERANFIKVDELDSTERGAGGFGSTGK